MPDQQTNSQQPNPERGAPLHPQLHREFPAPQLGYLPRDPKSIEPSIGLIGCGGITVEHLRAYRKAGYRVVALCDPVRKQAEDRRSEFYPKASVYEDHRELLGRDDIEVVDIATHPAVRVALVEDAIRAGKHVLSQKPFVLDLDVGQRLADMADQHKVRLAVNQNARWAPHFSYLRQAVQAGLIGEVASVHCSVHWDHNWVHGTEFDNVRHLILYDFAIHWFDMLTCLMAAQRPVRVTASVARSAWQLARPPLLGQCLVEYPQGQASLIFDGSAKYGHHDRTYLAGSEGTLVSEGVDCKHQQVTLSTSKGIARPKLKGVWFPDGFHGAMGELLCAIEEDREPENSARSNLESLALCFAAVASAERHEPVVPGEVRAMPRES